MAKYVTASNVARLHLHKEDNISTTDVLRALKAYNTAIIGAQSSYKGQAIDVVCASEETAAEIATHGIDHEDRHYNLRVALKPRIHVSVFVPIGMPDEVLATLMARYGNVQKTRRLHHKDEDLSHYENGVRVIEFDALTQPIPSRVSFAGINIGFKYTGQPKTCVRCMSFDHLVKECPEVRRPKLPNNNQQTIANEPSPPGANATASPQPSHPAVNESTPTVDPTDLPFGSASDNDSDAEEVSEDEETKSECTNARLAADNNTDKTLQPMDPTPPKLGIKRALLQSPTKPTTKKLISTQSQFELSLQDIHCPSQFFSVKLAAVTKAHIVTTYNSTTATSPTKKPRPSDYTNSHNSPIVQSIYEKKWVNLPLIAKEGFSTVIGPYKQPFQHIKSLPKSQ